MIGPRDFRSAAAAPSLPSSLSLSLSRRAFLRLPFPLSSPTPFPADFVELPPSFGELRYSNLLCGVIRGALEMLSVRVECHFARDALNGDDATEIRVQLKEVLGEGAGKDYKED